MSDTGAGSPPSRVAVVGAGTMGTGIALCFAVAGSSVGLTSRRAETRKRAQAAIAAGLGRLVAHGALDEAAARSARARVRVVGDEAAALDGAALVIETVVEDLDVKLDVLARLEAAAPADAVLATNTSSLSLDALASALRAPSRFAAMHWFNPPELVPLVEVVAAPGTAPITLDRTVAWARAAGKQPVRLDREVPGFVANRLQYALMREAWALVESGVCDYAAVDTAMTAGIGARWAAVGPFETMDLAGLDVHASVAAELFPKLSTATEVPAALRDAVAAGRLGVKTGDGSRGSYDDAAIASLVRHRSAILLALAQRSRC